MVFLAGMAGVIYWLFLRRGKQRASDVRRSIEDPTFGVMLLDETTGELELHFDLYGQPIPCTFGPIDTVEGTIALASSIAPRLVDLDRAARDFAAHALLSDANDWRDPDALEITIEGFAARMGLATLRADIGGGMIFLYDADGMFAERGIQVAVDQARGPLSAHVAIPTLLSG